MFSDKLGRQWDVSITLGDIARVKRIADIDLNDAIRNTELLVELLTTPVKLGALLWALLERQATAKGIDPESFADGMDGPTLQAAYEKVIGAVADFSQPPKIAASIRERIKTLIQKIDERGNRELSNKLDSILADS